MTASDPGEIEISWPKLNSLSGTTWWDWYCCVGDDMDSHLRYGDSRAAVVISTEPRILIGNNIRAGYE